MTHHFFLSADAQLAKLVEDPEEWIHHAHGPSKDDAHPDDIGCKGVGGVTPEPPIMPWAPIPRVCCTCVIPTGLQLTVNTVCVRACVRVCACTLNSRCTMSRKIKDQRIEWLEQVIDTTRHLKYMSTTQAWF